MTIRIFLFFLILLSHTTKGQTKELGLFVGYSNLVGDIGNNNPISPVENGNFTFDPAVGIFYKNILNPRVAIKFSGYYSSLRAEDANSPRADRIARNLTTESTLYEASAVLEYNFFDIYNGVYKSTPYIFAGFGGIMHQSTQVIADYSSVGAPTSATDFDSVVVRKKLPYRPKITIPFGVGYKFRIQEKYMLGFEFGVRATMYDNLDGSNPKKYVFIIDSDIENDLVWGPQIIKNINQAQNKYKTGNTTNFDWYTFTGITFSYLFGEPPCYCK